MRSLDSAFLDRLTLTPEHGSTLRALGEHRGEQELYRQQTPEALETLRTVAMVESTESSNRLEGVVASPDRLREGRTGLNLGSGPGADTMRPRSRRA